MVEALQRLLGLAMEKVRTAGIGAVDVVLTLVDTIKSVAVGMIEKSRKIPAVSFSITTS